MVFPTPAMKSRRLKTEALHTLVQNPLAIPDAPGKVRALLAQGVSPSRYGDPSPGPDRSPLHDLVDFAILRQLSPSETQTVRDIFDSLIHAGWRKEALRDGEWRRLDWVMNQAPAHDLVLRLRSVIDQQALSALPESRHPANPLRI
jgi:hypothetical protein